MTANDIRGEVERLVFALLEHSIAVDANRVVTRSAGGDEWVTWASVEQTGLTHYAVPTVDEYLRLVQQRHYTALLADFSILQLSFLFRRGNAIKQRLCFCPCPLLLDSDEVQEFGLIDYVDLLTDEDLLSRTRLDGPIRIDFDHEATKPGHPTVHLTISRESCRIPIFGPISVGHFIRFVFANFYREWWERHEFIREWPLRWSPRTIAEEECVQLYLECRRPLADKLRQLLGRT